MCPVLSVISGRSYLNLIRRLKRKGYKVHLFFLSLIVSCPPFVTRCAILGKATSVRNFFRDYRAIEPSTRNRLRYIASDNRVHGEQPPYKYLRLIRQYGDKDTNS